MKTSTVAAHQHKLGDKSQIVKNSGNNPRVYWSDFLVADRITPRRRFAMNPLASCWQSDNCSGKTHRKGI
jgi:hypothetical protein